MNVDKLFETCSIKDIKTRHIESRSEIENKKGELRYLVSERYRDIIDAADNIFDMKKYSDGVTTSLRAMNVMCQKWEYLQTTLKENGSLDESKLRNKLHLAAQIKLMLNMSDLIWNTLESNQFVDAAMLFCLCRNMSIHSKLSIEKFQYEEIDAQLMFSRQWNSLSNLEGTIVLVCQRYLRSRSIQKDIAKSIESLIGIILVKGSTLYEVLDEYLLSKKLVIAEWFSPQQNSQERTDNQLLGVIGIIVDTISDVYNLFIDGALMKSLEPLSEITVKNMDCTRAEKIYRFLPEQISVFKPAQATYKQNKIELEIDEVTERMNCWLKEVLSDHQSNFENCFSHLSTVKSAYETHSELKKMLTSKKFLFTSVNSKFESIEFDNREKWLQLLERVFMDRLKVLIDENFSTFFLNWKNDVEKFLNSSLDLINKKEFNSEKFLEFTWFNSTKDVMLNPEINSLSSGLFHSELSPESKVIFKLLNHHFSSFFNFPAAFSSKNGNFESMAIKLKAIRPEIFQNTKVLNEKLSDLVMEILDIITGKETMIWKLLIECTSSLYTKTIDWANSLLDNAKTVQQKHILKKSNSVQEFNIDSLLKTECSLKINKIQLTALILSQALRSLYELSPTLQSIVMAWAYTNRMENSAESSNSVSSIDIRKRHKQWRLPFLPSRRIQQYHDLEYLMWNTWFDYTNSVKNVVLTFFDSITKDFISLSVVEYFQKFEYAVRHPNNWMHIITKWENIEVSSESLESNLSVTLKVPSQTSWPMHLLLLHLSSVIVSVGGQSFPRKGINSIRENLLRNILENFESFSLSNLDKVEKKQFIQNVSLQMIFDFRFLLEIISDKNDIENTLLENAKNLLLTLEKLLDPFDYSMMQDKLQNNMNQCVSRNSSLYSVLCVGNSANWSVNGSSKRIGDGLQHQQQPQEHNLIDLIAGTVSGSASGRMNTNLIRFGLLPVTGFSTMSHQSIPNPQQHNKNRYNQQSSVIKDVNNCTPSTIAASKTSAIVISSDCTVSTDCHVNERDSVKTLPHSNSTNYLTRLGSKWF